MLALSILVQLFIPCPLCAQLKWPPQPRAGHVFDVSYHAILHMSGCLALTSSLFHRSTILQQQFNRTGKAEHGSVALPAVMRSGSSGPETFNVGSMPSPQQQVMVGQMHRGHMPPLVRLLDRLSVNLWAIGNGEGFCVGTLCLPSEPLVLIPIIE